MPPSSRDLVREIDVSGGVDHAEGVLLTVIGPWHTHGLRFDRDAPLLLDVHAVEEPVAHLAFGYDSRKLEDAVCNG